MVWEPEVDQLRDRQRRAAGMGGAERVKRQHDAGRLTVRERIDELLDAGTFREAGSIAGRAEYDAGGELAGFTPANFVCGTGRLEGRTVVVGGDDFTVRGGAADASIHEKQVWAERAASQLRVPLIRLVDDPDALREQIRARLDAVRSPLRTAGKFGIEEIIDPRDTRPLLTEWVTDAYRALPALLGRPSFGTRP
jgi:acetyl-CoA carboxylase carboxyltransferase component